MLWSRSGDEKPRVNRRRVRSPRGTGGTPPFGQPRTVGPIGCDRCRWVTDEVAERMHGTSQRVTTPSALGCGGSESRAAAHAGPAALSPMRSAMSRVLSGRAWA